MTVLEKNRLANEIVANLTDNLDEKDLPSVLQLLNYRTEFKLKQLENED